MSKLKSSHSVSLPIAEKTPERQHGQVTRRHRKAAISLRGDESPAVELPPLPRWMLNTPINTKFPMIPAPKGKIVLFTTDICQTLHPSPSGLEFDPSAHVATSKYKSLHDPHLKQHYCRNEGTFDRLVRGGFVTSDGKVKCTLKEFNEFQQHLKRVRLEKLDQDQKLQHQNERDEKEKMLNDKVKTEDQLARQKRLEDTQKRWKKINKDKQKRLKQQLDAYDAKHACIITEQQMRKEIDEVRRELDAQRRINHKLQMEKEEREKKIVYLQKRAKEERRRVKFLEEREITKKGDRNKSLAEKWQRKQLFKDSRFAQDYLKKESCDLTRGNNMQSRMRKCELSWLKQQADLARITETRMRMAAEEEHRITVNLDKKLAIIRTRFERKLQRLQAMLQNGGVPPVIQLKRTHDFIALKRRREIQRELDRQRQRELALKREKERKRQIERQKLMRERQRSASVPAPVHVELLEMLPDVSASAGRPNWGETMSRTGMSPDILPPIRVEFEEDIDDDDESTSELEEQDSATELSHDIANDVLTETIHKVMARNVVDDAVHGAVASDIVTLSTQRAIDEASQSLESVPSWTQNSVPMIVVESAEDVEVECSDEDLVESEVDEVQETETEPTREVKEAHSLIASRTLAMDAICSACDDLDTESTHQIDLEQQYRRESLRATPSDLARTITGDVLEGSFEELGAEGIATEGTFRKTPSNVGRGLTQGAIQDAVDEVAMADYQLRQTPSNVGQLLATHVYYGALGDLQEMTEAKLCFTFKDRTRKARELNGISGVCDEVLQAAPVDVTKSKSGGEMENDMTDLQDRAEDFHVIDNAVCRQSSSDIARDCVPSAEVIDVHEDIEADTSPRLTPSMHVAKTLAISAIARAQDEIGETYKIYKARKKSRSLESGRNQFERPPKRKPRETRSDVARSLAKGAIDDAAMDLEMEGNDVDDVGRKTPSNIARDLAETTIDSATNDLEADPVYMHVIYRKTPSNLARALAEDAVKAVTDTLVHEDVAALRSTPSNVARELARGALVEAVHEINNQDSEYTLPTSFRNSPSDMSRGIAEDVLLDVMNDFHKEGKSVDGTLRATASNTSRGLVKQAINDADQELQMQPSAYSVTCQKTSSNFARAVVSDVMDGAIFELESEGHMVDGTARLTPSNLARDIVSGTIMNAQDELHETACTSESRVVRGQTPSSIAREITSDAIIDGITEIENEGKIVEGVLRKTPSNLGRILAQDVIGEALGDIAAQPARTNRPLPQASTPKAFAVDVSPKAMTEINDDQLEDDYYSQDDIADELEFNEDDFREMYGNSSAMLASVMDVFSHTTSTISPFKEELDEDDDDDDDGEEIIGILDNPLIAEATLSNTRLPGLTRSDIALTEIVHITDEDKVVVEGVVKISSEALSAAGSVTEAVLSMEKLSKNSSGQLVRESSESSSGEEIISSITEESNQGLQFFKLVPFYNNKSIDVGDDIIKSNLSAISIKPDPKLALAGAHQPQSRNSFRNIFRPDMTHCEGSARCLKDTLVTKFSQEPSSTESQKKVLDECCKVLDEAHPEITARHSDEELVTIGDVEGVCMWPKRRAYQKHFVNEPVQEKPEDDETETRSPEMKSDHKSDSEIEATPERQSPKKANSQSQAESSDQSHPEPTLSSTVNAKPEPVVVKHDDHEVAQTQTNNNQDETQSRSGVQTDIQTNAVITDVVASKPNVVSGRRASDLVPTSSPQQHQQQSGQNICAFTNEYDDEQSKLLSSKDTSGSSINNGNTASGSNISRVPDVEGSTQVAQLHKQLSTESHTSTRNSLTETVVQKSPERTSSESSSSQIQPKHKVLSSSSGLADETGTSGENAYSQPIVPTEQASVHIHTGSNTTSATGTTPRGVNETSASNHSSSSSVEEGATRKKSGVSYIYVKPADPNISRTSCTVLVAGKSISRSSGASTSSESTRRRRRGKTPDGTPHRPTPSVVLHEVKPTKKTRNSSARDASDRDAHHLPVVTKTESEDCAGLREHMQSQTALRKLSHQMVPTSSHRILEMSCKLSHSAGELEGRSSNQLQGSSELSAETNKEAQWPISGLTSECYSDSPDEGLRTPSVKSAEVSTAMGNLSTDHESNTGNNGDSSGSEVTRRSSPEHVVHQNSAADNVIAEHRTASSSHSQSSGVLGRIISRVFSFGRRRSSQVVPLSEADEAGVKSEAGSSA